MLKSKEQLKEVSVLEAVMIVVIDLIELIKKLGGSLEYLFRLATPDGRVTLEKIAQVIVNDMRKVEVLPVVGKLLMTVKYGAYLKVDVDYLRSSIKSSGKKISDYSNRFLEKIFKINTNEEINLWEVSGADLGFTEAVPLGKIYECAFELGFIECPVEAFAVASIKCTDEKERIACMDKSYITDRNGNYQVLALRLIGFDYCLSTRCANPDVLYAPDVVVVFARP